MLHFDPKDFEVFITNIVSNIFIEISTNSWTNTIIYFTRWRLLQSYLLPIITQKDGSNLFYLYYRSFMSHIALVINFRWCVHIADARTYSVARLITVSTVPNFTKWMATKWTHTNASKIALSKLRNS